ncbi:MAG: hypothetical protein Q9227_000337 [Pyrenula ochraceoflavens]
MDSGGFIEQLEAGIDPHARYGELANDSIFWRWHQFGQRSEEAFGKPLFIANYMKDAIARAGFVDVVEKKFRWPLGPWGDDNREKEMGRFNKEWWLSGNENWTLAVGTRYMGVRAKATSRLAFTDTLNQQWSVEQIKSFVAETKKVLDDETSEEVYYEVSVFSNPSALPIANQIHKRHCFCAKTVILCAFNLPVV